MLEIETLGAGHDAQPLSRRFAAVRRRSLQLVAPLSPEDMVVQSMPDASPAKWHLAHTTWFFETFLLQRADPGYACFDPAFGYLFNSYYEAIGPRHPRPHRGLLTRPPLSRVLAYRDHVDAAMQDLLHQRGVEDAGLRALVELGLHHEEQHQELLLTDILHAFSCNPVDPVFAPAEGDLPDAGPVSGEAGDGSQWSSFDGGVVSVGHDGNGFAFDCEGPRHEVLLQPFRLARRPVTNGDWLAFMADDGYRRPELWLADGWARVQAEGWTAPLYWREEAPGRWSALTLRGRLPVDAAAPVGHLSYFEADAFASWAGHRLPTEAEWEHAAARSPATGNLLGSAALCPRALPAAAAVTAGPAQLFGDVWEWTRSAYCAYPGFRPAAGAVGEYNGKFMSGQFVLRGGSCLTPDGHVRASYRNFFYPHQRWQMTGLRLAADA